MFGFDVESFASETKSGVLLFKVKLSQLQITVKKTANKSVFSISIDSFLPTDYYHGEASRI